LDFLLQQNLVEEQIVCKKKNKTRVVYMATERGRTVLKYFRELESAFQIAGEGKKIHALLY